MKKIYLALNLLVVLGVVLLVKTANGQMNNTESSVISPQAPSAMPQPVVCAQVITPAKDPVSGKCKNFPTACDVPSGWQKVEECENEMGAETKPAVPPTNTGAPTEMLPQTGAIPPAETMPPEGTMPVQKVPPTAPTNKEIPNEMPSDQPLAPTALSVPSTTKAMPLPISVNVCALSDSYLKEINELIKQADLAKQQGDVETEKNITEKIKLIKEKIELKKKECANAAQMPLSVSQAPQQQNIATGQNIIKEDFCQTEKQIISKIEYYKGLLSLSAQELAEKGYAKEELGKMLGELQNERAKVHAACSGEKTGLTVSQLNQIKPLAAENAEQIANYYKEKMAQIMEKPLTLPSQTQEIKKMKEEATVMTKELIRTQNQISVKELQPIVEKFVFQPGMIETAQTQVKIPQEKKIEIAVQNKTMEIAVSNERMSIKEGTVVAETKMPLAVENEKLVMNGTEVKITPEQMLKKVAIENPVDLKIELTAQNNSPAYQVKAVERKKLFFLIPVNVQKELTVDASTEQARKIKEDKPWWSFLAF